MSRCTLLKKCPFFNDELGKRPAEAFQYKRIYCLDNYRHCARFIMHEALGGRVPTNLFPNQGTVAKAMLERMGIEPASRVEPEVQPAVEAVA